MHSVRGPATSTGNGDASAAVRVPHPVLRMRHVLPASPKGRAVRHPRRADLLQAGLREGDVSHATCRRRYDHRRS